MDTSHLTALHIGLCNEKKRLAEAGSEQERAIRTVWVQQRECEYKAEMLRLGMNPNGSCDLSDDDLLKELEE